jgi:hypothetical protein
LAAALSEAFAEFQDLDLRYHSIMFIFSLSLSLSAECSSHLHIHSYCNIGPRAGEALFAALDANPLLTAEGTVNKTTHIFNC